MQLSIEQQREFWSLVKKSSMSGCWLWSGPTVTKMRYGRFQLNAKQQYAHRVSWSLSNGEIPKGQCVLHKCDTPACINPEHLFLGSRRDNMIDKVMKGRQHYGVGTGGAVLTDQKVSTILYEYACGDTSALELAARYGVNESTMRSVINGKTWLHVPGPRMDRKVIIALGKLNRANARKHQQQLRSSLGQNATR